MSRLRIPIASYRLQFNERFHFEDAQALVPYLHQLGISDLYASPIFKAREGSTHGYDVTDPLHLNPELGTEKEFEALVQELSGYGMGLLLDIVPNHMVASPENLWWADVLENGQDSPYAAFFDINWNPPDSALKNKVLLPILASPYRQALENGEFILSLEDTGLSVHYHGYRLPLDVKSYGSVIPHRLHTLETKLGAEHPAVKQLKRLVEAIKRLPSCSSEHPGKARKRYRERQALKEELLRLVKASPEVKTFLVENIALFNGKKGDTQRLDPLDKLLAQQEYRLAFWETAREQINYRRFFDISDLIGVRVEDPRVFAATHALAFRLVQEGKITGLRIDHVDGLYDPLRYLLRLQRQIMPEVEGTGRLPGFYIVVEKILLGDEVLPKEWPVFGTTGYDFLNVVNALFVDGGGVQTIDTSYSRFIGAQETFDDVVYEKKRQVMKELFAGEINALGRKLAYLAQQAGHIPDLSPKELTNALIEITACLPIYRTYVRTLKVSRRDRQYLEGVTQEVRRRNPALGTSALDFLKRVLILDFPTTFSSEQKEPWAHFVLRWQQLTGAVMAKGFEDTALYTYNRLVSLNEVGGDPGCVGLSVDEFHRCNLTRRAHFPYTLNATSTHDTKRSEDIRARINVLSEIPGEWEKHLTQWSRWNQAKKRRVDGLPVPEPDMEVLLYHTLVGAWPFSQEEVSGFKERVKSYMVKATREAKVYTSWLRPNPEYEDALLKFTESILEISNQNEFLPDFLQFEKQIAYYGFLNSLAQVLLKTTSPGVPDFYQGTELWNLSLVDPDNRRPVDFQRRIKLLDDLIKQEAQGQQSLIRQVLKSWEDGRVKLYLTYKALNVRRSHRDLFLDGDYISLQIRGQRQEHVCAFARRKSELWALVIIPRLLTKLVYAGTLPLGRRVWGDDFLILPEDAPQHWLNVLTGETFNISLAIQGVPLCHAFSTFPVALLAGTV
ncbi:MAG: malto-oligosyltrehalose synthase [Dehalococcoidia bacterium]|nr:malto-oligosyltrehalose synthase [Dehalococcoidia bacterium]